MTFLAWGLIACLLNAVLFCWQDFKGQPRPVSVSLVRVNFALSFSTMPPGSDVLLMPYFCWIPIFACALWEMLRTGNKCSGSVCSFSSNSSFAIQESNNFWAICLFYNGGGCLRGHRVCIIRNKMFCIDTDSVFLNSGYIWSDTFLQSLSILWCMDFCFCLK